METYKAEVEVRGVMKIGEDKHNLIIASLRVNEVIEDNTAITIFLHFNNQTTVVWIDKDGKISDKPNKTK